MNKQPEDSPVYFPELLGHRFYMEGKLYQVIGSQLMGRGLAQVEVKMMLLPVPEPPKELESWHCDADHGKLTYSIIPFNEGSYYGLYVKMSYPECSQFCKDHSGWEASKGMMHIAVHEFDAVELPPFARFASVAACKEFVSETCSAMVEWKSSKYGK